MFILYDKHAPKRPTNLTVNSDLLLKAKELKLNISSILEDALAERVKQEKRNEWLRENADAITTFNRVIEDKGLFGDDMRTF